jgi:hypothetical protein
MNKPSTSSFDEGIDRQCGANLAPTRRFHDLRMFADSGLSAPDQGQNMSLVSAKTIKDRIAVSPMVISSFNARAVGGLPVTASNA